MKKLCQEFLNQRANKNEWLIKTKNKLYDLCKQIVILDQYVLVRICGKLNDDEMLKNIF